MIVDSGIPDSGVIDSGIPDSGPPAPIDVTLNIDVDGWNSTTSGDGGVSTWGSLKNALLMAVDDETDGGYIPINGTRIKGVNLVVREVKCTNAAGVPDLNVARDNVQKDVITNAKTIGFVGSGCGSAVTQAILPATASAGIVHFSASSYVGLTKPVVGLPFEPASYYPTGVKNFARLNLPDDAQGPKAAAWIKKLGGTKVFLLHNGLQPELGVVDAVRASLSANTLTEGGYLSVAAGITSADAALLVTNDIQPSGADVVFLGASIQGIQGAIRIAQAIRQNPATATVKIVVPNNIGSAAFLTGITAAYTTDIYAITVGLPASRYTGKTLAWYNAYKAKYPTNVYVPLAPIYYEAGSVLIRAIKSLGDQADSRDAVRKKVLATQSFDGVLGNWSLDANGDISVGFHAGNKANGLVFDFVEVL